MARGYTTLEPTAYSVGHDSHFRDTLDLLRQRRVLLNKLERHVEQAETRLGGPCLEDSTRSSVAAAPDAGRVDAGDRRQRQGI